MQTQRTEEHFALRIYRSNREKSNWPKGIKEEIKSPNSHNSCEN